MRSFEWTRVIMRITTQHTHGLQISSAKDAYVSYICSVLLAFCKQSEKSRAITYPDQNRIFLLSRDKAQAPSLDFSSNIVIHY